MGHVAGCFILTVRMKHPARCLAHFRAGAPNRRMKYDFLVYTNTNLTLLFKYTPTPLLGAPALK